MRIRWRGLELPSQVAADRATLSSTYGKFTVEPFERGFGVTVGNSLRRVLLSSLEGSAVTQIKLHGAQHEFTTLPGVLDDVTDIVLNVKSLVVKNHSEQTRVVRIEKNTRGPVTGADHAQLQRNLTTLGVAHRFNVGHLHVGGQHDFQVFHGQRPGKRLFVDKLVEFPGMGQQ